MDIKDLVVIDALGNRYILIPETVRSEPVDIKVAAPASVILLEAPGQRAERSFGEKLRSRREAEGLVQEQLEAESGILQPNLSAYEKGTRHPRPPTQTRLISAWEKLTGKSWE